MTDTKTHDETTITPLVGTEEVYVVGSGGTDDGKATTMAISRVGALSMAKVTASAAQILSAHTTPIVLVPAQGAGTIIMPVAVAMKYNPGAYPFGKQGGGTESLHLGAFQVGDAFSFVPVLETWKLVMTPGIIGEADPISAKNEPLTWQSDDLDFLLGNVATVVVHTAGSGYAPGDQFGGATWGNATFAVASVDGGGAVTGISIFANATEPAATNEATSNVTGTGTGLTIDVTITPGDGTLDFATAYFVM